MDMPFKKYVFQYYPQQKTFIICSRRHWTKHHAFECKTLDLVIPEFEQVHEAGFKFRGKGGVRAGYDRLAQLGMNSVDKRRP